MNRQCADRQSGKWKNPMRKFSPEQLRVKVEKATQAGGVSLTTRVAQLVWWDFYSERSCAKRVTEFDRYLQTYYRTEKCEDEEAIRNSLVVLGYPEDVAIVRARPPNYT